MMRTVYALCTLATLLVTTAQAETQFTIGKSYADHDVKEGYANDIDKMQADQLEHERQIGVAPELRRWLAKERAGDGSRHPNESQYVTISDIRASVYSDDDHDGYYTNFVLNFDVDSHYGYEYVYAKIYLRDPHSDYTLFHVTGVFEIYSDLSSDRYRVDSKLVNNFNADHYDVKIDILIAGDPTVQDGIDGSMHTSLRGLPLEADSYDGNTQSDIVVHEHTGSLSAPTLAFLVFVGLAVRIRRSTLFSA